MLTRTATLSGVFVPALGQGLGYYLLPEMPDPGPPATTLKTSPIVSGGVRIEGLSQ